MPKSAVSVIREEANALPRNATIYGFCELARRAGVPHDLLQRWRFEFDDAGYTSVFVCPGTRRKLRFPQLDWKTWREVQLGTIRTSIADWPSLSTNRPHHAPDLRIPFSSSIERRVGPLFMNTAPDVVTCSVDLAASTVLTLSRFEETLPHACDEHGRFAATSSVAWREGFLHRPVVDEWGLALAEALQQLLPGWCPCERRLRVKLGHDADVLGIPMILRTTLAHTLRRGRPDATVRDLFSLLFGCDTAYQRSLRQLVQFGLNSGLDCAVYWKSSPSGRHDTGYELRDPRIQRMIAEFRSKGIEMGVHPSYQSFESSERLYQEIRTLQKTLGNCRLGGRQDFVRWVPALWPEWESLDLAYDASVGFADQTGFRAGTCYPYHPWLFRLGREADILEIPLLAMDSTLYGYMRLTADEALQNLRDLVAACRAVGGVFSLAWHNTTLMNTGYWRIYRQLLQELSGSERYDWQSSCDDLN